MGMEDIKSRKQAYDPNERKKQILGCSGGCNHKKPGSYNKATTVIALMLVFLLASGSLMGCGKTTKGSRSDSVDTSGVFESGAKNTCGNTSGNLSNIGMAAQEGNWIYCSPRVPIYKLKNDDSGKTQICDDNAWFINVVNDWIYYSNGNDSAKLYKIRSDGSSRTRLNDEESSYICVLGDWIYYSNSISKDGHLYKIKTDGSSRTKICDDAIGAIYVADDWIYYINSNDSYKLYKIKTDGSSRTKLSDDWIPGSMNVVGDWIYYGNGSDSFRLYKIKTDGSGYTILIDDAFWDINVVGDWIYYSNNSDNGNLYKIRMDGTGRTKLYGESSNLGESTDWINVVGDWIYFATMNKRLRIHTNGSGLEELQ
jgi:hypothetical protein